MAILMLTCPGIRAGIRCRYRLNPADQYGLCWHCWQVLPETTTTALQHGGADRRAQLHQHLADRTPLEQIEVT